MKKDVGAPAGPEAIRRPRGRPRTASDDAKRTAILAEARKTFHEFGYAGTTMDLVATRCKMSKQTLYRLFVSKTELFMAMITLHRTSMVALPRPQSENLPLRETLEKIFMIDLDEEAEDDQQTFIHFILSEAEHFPEIAVLLQEHGVQQTRRLLSEWLRVQHEGGRMVIQDAESGARMLLSIVAGALAPIPGNLDNWPSRQARRDHLRQCFGVFLNGVLPPHRT